MDNKFNYLICDICENFPEKHIIDKRNDPDSSCKKLYDDLKSIFFSNALHNKKYNINKVENKEQKDKNNNNYYTLFINKEEILLSSDYIGPSVYWAKEYGYVDSDINDWLKIARTIGGHIVFPRGFQEGYYYNYVCKKYIKGKNNAKYKNKYITINIAKGGASGFYDRADWVFELIKIYYSMILSEHSKEEFIEKCKGLLPKKNRDYIQFIERFETVYYAFENSKNYLQKFNSFEQFCDFFMLIGSFVDNDYNINKFAPLFPILPKEFGIYVQKNVSAIELRTNLILKQRL